MLCVISRRAFDNYFLQAQRVRKLIRSEFNSIFRQSSPLLPSKSVDFAPGSASGVDVLIHPSAISTAPRMPSALPLDHTQQGHHLDSSAHASYTQDALTVPASLAGLPALSVPIGKSADDGWPLGAQVTGQWGADDLVLTVGEAIEEDVAQWR